ncbi:MAG: DUF3179 domain-containing protein [Isosphaeraceae bacterium]|nr:DUF3179 domain-containing protein [Isosphaeraceae bacterium]
MAPMAPIESPPPPGYRRASVLSRFVCLGILALLLAFIATEAPQLWAEFQALRLEQARDRQSRVVGYEGIHPIVSYAQRPSNWYHHEGEETLLWSGWTPGVGHGWFRIGRGEIERDRLWGPIGRDVIRAIDRPIVEVGSGRCWEAIPPEATIAGLEWAGVHCAYPVQVLEKVEVVNDSIRGQPLLVIYLPFAPDDHKVQFFDPEDEGERISMGLSGYFHDQKPLLYDRKTESLWVVRQEGLTAIAGRRKGARLRRIGVANLLSWGDWVAHFPRSRLVVGADRSAGAGAR